MIYNKKQSICWDCARSMPKRGCEWADSFSPVCNWEAVPEIKSGSPPIETFKVLSCPKFIKGRADAVPKENT